MTARRRTRLRSARANLLLGPGGEERRLSARAVDYPLLSVAEKWRRAPAGAACRPRRRRLLGVARHVARPGVTDRSASTRGSGPGVRALLASQRTAIWPAVCPEIYLAVTLDPEPAGGLGGALVNAADRARRRSRTLRPAAACRVGRGELERLAAPSAALRALRAASLACAARGPPSSSGCSPARAARHRRARTGAAAGSPTRWSCSSRDRAASRLRAARAGPVAPVGNGDHRAAHRPPAPPGRSRHGDRIRRCWLSGRSLTRRCSPGPMAELLHAPLEAVGFAVDAVLHARWLGNREALARSESGSSTSSRSTRDQTEVGARPRRAGRGGPHCSPRVRGDPAGLRQHPPMLYASIRSRSAPRDASELERRVAALRDQFGDVRLHRPRGLQEALCSITCRAPTADAVRDYIQQVTVEQFGALMPIAHRADRRRSRDLSRPPAARRPAGAYDATAPSRESRARRRCCSPARSGRARRSRRRRSPTPPSGAGRWSWTSTPSPTTAGPHRRARRRGRGAGADGRPASTRQARSDGDRPRRAARGASPQLPARAAARPAAGSWEHAIAPRRARHRPSRRAQHRSRASQRCARARRHRGREAADALEVLADFGLARLGFGDGAGRRAVRDRWRPVTTIRTPGLTLPDPARRGRPTRARSGSRSRRSRWSPPGAAAGRRRPQRATRSSCSTRRGSCWPPRRAARWSTGSCGSGAPITRPSCWRPSGWPTSASSPSWSAPT